MAEARVRSRKRVKRVEPEDLTARIVDYSTNYFRAAAVNSGPPLQ